MVMAALIPNESVLGLEDDCMLKALNPVNESKLKLKQEKFEQGIVLEPGKSAQTPFAVAYYAYNSVSLGSDTNLGV